jgi:putative NADPH-quinone reductase
VNVLVVFAHPSPESFAAAVLESVVVGLRSSGHEIRRLDLYADGYTPGSGLPTDHRAALVDAGALVLVHPTWWTAQPAILLDWLDYAASTGLPSARALVSVTTYGGSRLANWIAGESGSRTVSGEFRERCANKPRHRRLALYGLDTAGPESRRAFLDRVENRIGRLVDPGSPPSDRVRR